MFLVANDKFKLYSKIAELVGMKIIKQYNRPVLSCSEKDSNVYSESVFHLSKSYKFDVYNEVCLKNKE